jgi:predicted kinase
MEAVIFTGIPGSGKSTFYRERFFNTHLRINLDMLKTRKRELALVEACIATRQRFVVDNTNINPEERARYIRLAKPVGFRILSYYFDSSLEEAMERNRQRSGPALVPTRGMLAKFSRIIPPRKEEGFDQLFLVRIDPDSGSFVVSENYH